MVAQKEKFYIFALLFTFSLQIIVDTSNLVLGLNIASPSLQMTNLPSKGALSLLHDLFNLWKISDNISKTVQNSLIFTIIFE